jgi:hypothetical protein
MLFVRFREMYFDTLNTSLGGMRAHMFEDHYLMLHHFLSTDA